jgi:hypothetical protein
MRSGTNCLVWRRAQMQVTSRRYAVDKALAHHRATDCSHFYEPTLTYGGDRLRTRRM